MRTSTDGGAVGSLAATYYSGSSWLLQLRASRIVTRNSIDTSSLMLGVGYQLEPVTERRPMRSAPYQAGRTTNDEFTVFLGRTIVNSYHSEHDTAAAIEYRHGLARHVDVSVGVINEGDARLARRRGVAAQIWGGARGSRQRPPRLGCRLRALRGDRPESHCRAGRCGCQPVFMDHHRDRFTSIRPALGCALFLESHHHPLQSRHRSAPVRRGLSHLTSKRFGAIVRARRIAGD